MNNNQYIASVGGQGILSFDDVGHLKRGERMVFDIMCDRQWHTIEELREKTGQAQADRRMRNLRNHGYVIERRKVSGSRIWRYRMTGERTEPNETTVDDVRVKNMHHLERCKEVIDSLGGLDHARRIAEALPRTADGVVVVAGDCVWHQDWEYPSPLQVHPLNLEGVPIQHWPESDDEEYVSYALYREQDTGLFEQAGFSVSDCYSTQEAAEAAAKQSGADDA